MGLGSRLPAAIFLMGPTASGKTGLAVELVQRLPLEIISVDSAMVYRGMDIGTAKPDADTLSIAPHRLIDILDPEMTYSAARFRTDALREMAEITARGKVPLLVGGTMLYFRALYEGLSALPEANLAVRARIDAQAAERGWASLHARLSEVDPLAAARIHPNDPQRVQRALEIYELAGQPMTDLCARPRSEILQYSINRLILMPDNREKLRARITERFDGMLSKGLMDEVAGLHRRDELHPGLPALRAVGYRQIWQYLDGAISYRDMVIAARTAGHRLAKRQLTWLRAEPNARRFDPEDRSPARIVAAIDSQLV
ncbi:MAG: tRNA (adenosine(37)-N6)-dimethylallyltransferase MiaA [Gammaproteobacteria bacterium]|nr:tRNA (adenosine(37)-N6)-dimethylallyltransferase MiaA [Gammaproteobacteria bacterium]MBA3731977.1 tRNA (adenosine(37)-N6)-dimethylallyltransferase MiaA [Gammaproteobacteria bacterium]